MRIQGFDFLDLGGGLNEGQPMSSINPNECTVLRNLYPFWRKLVRRGGVRLLTTSGNWDENIFSMFPLKTSAGDWTLLVGGATKLGKLSGNTIADLPSSLTIPSQSTPWVWFQYKDFAYCMREGQTDILRADATSWYTAGIAAPTVGPTLADGGAGNLTAANYYGVFTFYWPCASAAKNRGTLPERAVDLGGGFPDAGGDGGVIVAVATSPLGHDLAESIH